MTKNQTETSVFEHSMEALKLLGTLMVFLTASIVSWIMAIEWNEMFAIALAVLTLIGALLIYSTFQRTCDKAIKLYKEQNQKASSESE